MAAELSVFHPAVTIAANWLREKYNIANSCTVEDEFTKEFNCKYRYVLGKVSHSAIAAIQFETESDKLLFLLRSTAWS